MYQAYKRTGGRYASKADEVFASINRHGLIYLNSGLTKRIGEDRLKFCTLYYDEDTKRVGVEFARRRKATTDGTQLKVVKIRNGEVNVISAVGMLNTFKIAKPQKRLPITFESEDFISFEVKTKE
jgi:hypothetical protein